MAEPEHLEIVRQGTEAILNWRQRHPDYDFDLSAADLSRINLAGADLQGANLNDADLRHANLVKANLSDATLCDALLNRINLSHANLFSAYLEGACLCGAFLNHSDLSEAGLAGTDLRGADLSEADLENTDFTDADLSNTLLHRTIFYRTWLNQSQLCGAKLTAARLTDVSLTGTDFDQVISAYNQWNNLDLSEALHLETVTHAGPSSLGIDTLVRSQGTIPDLFLRGCGVPKHVISQIPDLFSRTAIPYDSSIIVQISEEPLFAYRLLGGLQKKGIRCWLDEELHFIANVYRPFIFGSELTEHIRILFCISKKSLEDEQFINALEEIFQRESARSATNDPQIRTIIPLIIDDASLADWNHSIRDQILEFEAISFSGWEHNPVRFEQQLNQLVIILKTNEN